MMGSDHNYPVYFESEGLDHLRGYTWYSADIDLPTKLTLYVLK